MGPAIALFALLYGSPAPDDSVSRQHALRMLVEMIEQELDCEDDE